MKNDDIGVKPLSLQYERRQWLDDHEGSRPKGVVGGPSTWPRHKGFGQHYDYEVLEHGEFTVLFPVCDAALQFLYYILPADTPRWGVNEQAMNGFKIESDRVDRIMDAMYKKWLFSDLDKAKEEDDMRRQWND